MGLFSFFIFITLLFPPPLFYVVGFLFPRSGNLPGLRNEQWELGVLAEVTAHIEAIAGKNALYWKCFQGAKLYISSISIQHSPGYVKLPKSPYLWSQHKAFGIQEITCFSQGLGSRTAMGLLLRAEEGREQMRISTVVCPAVIKHGSTRSPLCVLPPELYLDNSIREPHRAQQAPAQAVQGGGSWGLLPGWELLSGAALRGHWVFGVLVRGAVCPGAGEGARSLLQGPTEQGNSALEAPVSERRKPHLGARR